MKNGHGSNFVNKNALIISNGVRSSAREELRIRPEGGERVSRSVAEKQESFLKQRSVERLVSLLGVFHRKTNNVSRKE